MHADRVTSSGLWSFLAAWRTLFDRFDADHSGNISPSEFSDALSSFGYRLSSTFVGILYRTYDKGGNGAMSFDLFVQACIALKRMTDVFKRYDDDRDGYITLSFEEFLTGKMFLTSSFIHQIQSTGIPTKPTHKSLTIAFRNSETEMTVDDLSLGTIRIFLFDAINNEVFFEQVGP